ncbi:hypothetical protein ACFSDH_27130, partial [Pseudomonas rhodesiae]
GEFKSCARWYAGEIHGYFRPSLEENAAAVSIVLSPSELSALDGIFPADATAGLRYPEAVMAMLEI